MGYKKGGFLNAGVSGCVKITLKFEFMRCFNPKLPNLKKREEAEGSKSLTREGRCDRMKKLCKVKPKSERKRKARMNRLDLA